MSLHDGIRLVVELSFASVGRRRLLGHHATFAYAERVERSTREDLATAGGFPVIARMVAKPKESFDCLQSHRRRRWRHRCAVAVAALHDNVCVHGCSRRTAPVQRRQICRRSCRPDRGCRSSIYAKSKSCWENYAFPGPEQCIHQGRISRLP